MSWKNIGWKKRAAWALAVVTAVVLLTISAGYFYLKSSGFEQFAMRKIIDQANKSTGGRTEIRAFDFDLSTLTAHLYNVVLHGTEPADAPPLLQVDRLTVSLKIQSVFRRKVSLSELLIEHPVVHVFVDRDGKNNIPPAPPSDSSSNTNLFGLAVGHVGLSGGEVNYNDRKAPLEADLHDLKTDVAFEFLATRYRGSISYDNGHLRYGHYAPWPHSFDARFTATPSQFALESAVMKVASSTVSLRANATSYSNPVISGDYSVRLHAQDFAALAPELEAQGDVALTGKLSYQNQPNRPFLKNVSVNGRVGSEAMSAMVSGGRIEARRLQGTYQLDDGSLRVSVVQADSLGGRINAEAEVQNLDKTPASRVRAALHSISLQAAQQVLRPAAQKEVVIAGTLDGAAEASWTGNISNVRAHSDITLHAAVRNTANHSANVPVDGIIHANYDGPASSLSMYQTSLRMPSATLTANGQVSKHSSLQIRANTTDLHQLESLASAFRNSSSPLPAIAGTATVEATVTGSMQRPQIAAQLNTQNLRVEDSEWKTAAFSVQADPSRVVISNGTLVSAQKGKASFGATVALRGWSYLPANSIQATLSMEQMPIGDLQHLANVRYPVIGELSGKVTLEGSQLDPTGSGSLEIAKARVYDEPLQNLSLKFRGENGSVISTLNVAAHAGSAKADLTYTPRTKAYKVRLDAPSIVLEKLRAVQAKNLALSGTLSASANGEGTLHDPQLTASMQIPKLQVRDKSISGVNAQVRVANQQGEFTLDTQVVQSPVRVRGHVNLTGDYESEASIDTASLPLNVLLATYGGGVPEGFQGQTELHATLKGPLKNKAKLEAHLTIPTLNATYQTLQIGAAGPIRADYSNSVITVQPSEIKGTGTSIRVQGSIPLAGNTAPNLTAQGTIDARIVRIVSPDVRSSGTVALDIRTSGSASSPQIQGQVRLQNIALATASTPLGVEKLNGTLDIDNERVQISNTTGQVGGGQISAGGSITYRPSLQFNIALQGNSVRLRYPDGLRTVLDTNLAWTGDKQSSTLKGRVLINSLSFTPEFDVASFGDQFDSSAAGTSQPGFADTIGLQISVQSADNLAATSSQVSLEGSADLRVIGTAANPVITGRADLTSGELFYRNVRYELQRAIVSFEDPNQTRPVLNVSIGTTIEQYNLTLNLRGPLDKLTTSYVSDPPLATGDIINLIARGKTGSELAASSQSTDSMIASQAASQFSGSVQKLAGLSSLQIDPLLGGNNQNPSARVAIQQRVTKNFLFTFSTDVSEPGSETVQGDYQINKRWSVSVARDQQGGVSVDGRFHTKF